MAQTLVCGSQQPVDTVHKSLPIKRRHAGSSVPTKGKWTKSDDTKLMRLVEQHGVGCWSEIAQRMPGRIGKQCRERWCNHLQPGIKTEPWTIEEEQMLIDAHRQHGNRWSDIAKVIPGRPENHIKNYWNATLRRKDPLRPDGAPSLVKQYMVAEGLDLPTAPSGTAHSRLVYEDSESSDTEGTRPRRSKRIREGGADEHQVVQDSTRQHMQATPFGASHTPESWLGPRHMQALHPSASATQLHSQSPAPSLAMTTHNSFDSSSTRPVSVPPTLASPSFALPSEVYSGLMDLIDDADGLLCDVPPQHTGAENYPFHGSLRLPSLPHCIAGNSLSLPESWLLDDLDDLLEELMPCHVGTHHANPGCHKDTLAGHALPQHPAHHTWSFPNLGHSWGEQKFTQQPVPQQVPRWC